MDFWGYTDEEVKQAAEKHYGQKVKEVCMRTTGLWRSVVLADGHFYSVYEWMIIGRFE